MVVTASKSPPAVPRGENPRGRQAIFLFLLWSLKGGSITREGAGSAELRTVLNQAEAFSGDPFSVAHLSRRLAGFSCFLGPSSISRPPEQIEPHLQDLPINPVTRSVHRKI